MKSVSEIIAAHHDEILGSWIRGAAESASARGLTRRETAGAMPIYLSSLGRAAAGEPVKLAAGQMQVLERHLAGRVGHGFTRNEVLAEIALLGGCIVRVLDGAAGAERPPPDEVRRMLAELYLTSLAAASTFDAHGLEDQRGGERSSGRLDAMLSRGEAQVASSAHAGLVDFVEAVMAIMGAETAALYLFDPASDKLVLSASAGAADEHLDRQVSTNDASSLVGKIAASDERATMVVDVPTADLRMSDELRRSGVRSLLGIRIAARGRLRGVLYVGVGERRAFSAREIERIEVMAGTLAPHLESARLEASARERAADAAIEGELRERFVSVLMHDLSGPLASAQAGAAALIERTAGATRRTAAGIARELGRMQEMVATLVDVHRVRVDQPLLLHPSACDLVGVTADAVNELRASHGDRILLHTAGPVRGIWDAGQLRRAIWNLVANALQHGPGDRPVRVAVASTAEGAEVCVHDEGPAIAEADQERLFRWFALPGAAIHGPRHGWGLGLILVWGCAEAHGGRVSVDSRPGHGTTFLLQLPPDARPYVD